MISRRTAITAMTGVLTLLAWPAAAHEGHDHQSEPSATPAPDPVHEKALEYFTDLPVTTQDGRTLRFYSDVLKDKVVLVSLFFTDCDGACPVTTAKMAAIQDQLGETFGQSVHFVSISVDPETDTPAVMKDYAAQFGARDGWLFLTGEKEDLRTITYRLGHRNVDARSHPPLLLAADTRRGHWRKLMPNLPTAALTELLRELAEGT